MDLQAHKGLEALRERLHEERAQHCAGSRCGEDEFSFEGHVQNSS